MYYKADPPVNLTYMVLLHFVAGGAVSAAFSITTAIWDACDETQCLTLQNAVATIGSALESRQITILKTLDALPQELMETILKKIDFAFPPAAAYLNDADRMKVCQGQDLARNLGRDIYANVHPDRKVQLH